MNNSKKSKPVLVESAAGSSESSLTIKAKRSSGMDTLVEEAAEPLFAEEFIKRMFGSQTWERLENGPPTVSVECDTFTIRRRAGPRAGAARYELAQNALEGRDEVGIQLIKANSERLHFAALVDNHLFHEMEGVVYEMKDSARGRTDVIVKTGKSQSAPICYIIENKTTDAHNANLQRGEAKTQALTRLKRFMNDGKLASVLAVSLCYFDKSKEGVSAAKASEYYSHHANDAASVVDPEDRLIKNIKGSGMHIETYLMTLDEVRSAFAEGDGSSLLASPTSFAPALLHGIEKEAKLLDDSSEGLADVIFKTKVGDMQRHPKLNPSGASASQNTRSESEVTTMFLVHSILQSMAEFYFSWKEQGGGRPGDKLPLEFRNLGSNPREIHLIKGAFKTLRGKDLEKADSKNQIAYLTTNISAPNSQHSQEAYARIRAAIDRGLPIAGKNARASLSGKSMVEALGLSQSSDPTPATDRVAPVLLAKLKGLNGSEFEGFREFARSVELIGRVFTCHDQEHSQKLSANSNVSVKQNPEDIWIQKNRKSISKSMTALSEACQDAGIVTPIFLPKSHDERMSKQLSGGLNRVSIHDAAHWLSMDCWAREEQGKPIKLTEATREEHERARRAMVETLGVKLGAQMGEKLWREQKAYKQIFAASVGDRRAIYDNLDAKIFPSGAIFTKIEDAKRNLIDKLNGNEDPETIREYLGVKGRSPKSLKSLVSEAFNKKLIKESTRDILRARIEEACEDFEESRNFDAFLQAFNDCCSELQGKMESKLNPSLLHGAAHCALALEEFKAEQAAAMFPQKAGWGQAKLAKEFDRALLRKIDFWNKPLSFDRLVGMSVQMSRQGSENGHVIPDDYDMTDAAKREALRQTVRDSASAALSKIQALSDIEKRKEQNIVSHEFRHPRSAANLAENKVYSHLLDKMKGLGVPDHLGNFYEWFLKHHWPVVLSAEQAQAKEWIFPAKAKAPSPVSEAESRVATARPRAPKK